MAAQDRRLVALRAWAAWAQQTGAAVPADADLVAVAESGRVLDEQASAVAAWRPTIEHLLHQTKFGVNDPHLQLPDDLLRPVGGAVPPAPAPVAPESAPAAATRQDRSTDGLLTHLLADDSVRAPGLKDVHLKLIVKSGRRTVDEIRTFLPVGPDQQAEAIAASIAGYYGDVRVPDIAAAAPAPAATPPHRTAPTPPPAPAPVPEAPADEVVPFDGFAPYEYGVGGAEPFELVLGRDEEGAVAVSWAPTVSPAVYRVVAGDDEAPYSPDDARLVAATTGSAVKDPEPIGGVVRRYQVWRNDGDSVAAAKRAQPVLHAEGVYLAPVEQVALRYEPRTSRQDDDRVEPGRVVGQWSTKPGAKAVHVYRIPRRLAGQASGDARYRLDPASPNLNGFVDKDAKPGEKYLYQLVVEADVDGAALLSKPFVVPMDVPEQLDPIADLRVVRGGTGEVDLFWSAPAGGRVVVYRTRQEPAAGIGREAVSEALLAQQGALALEDRLAHPVRAGADGSESMTGVAWPAGWSRAFFTPVVLLGGRALVGPSARFADVAPVTRPVLVERVQRQLLMFDWPEGADSVEVYRSETGASSADALHGTPVEIGRDDYRERGGFELRALPPRGCDLHLVSVLFDATRRVLSEPVRVHYEGILRLGYTCTVKRPLFGQKGVFVSISAEFTPDRPPPFVLVHHPDRLPLSKFDGTSLAMVRDGGTNEPPSVQFRPRSLGRPEDAEQAWRTDDATWKRIAGAGGFVRLFVEVPPDKARRVALLDPPVATLRLGGRGVADG